MSEGQSDSQAVTLPRGKRVARAMGAFGSALFVGLIVLVCAILVAVLAALAIGGIASANEPLRWGTYTETSYTCIPGVRNGCSSFGTWVSEDGATTLTDVRLDGGVETNGSIRTSYREGGFNSDADNHIVHVETFSYGFVWAPIALLIAFFFMFGGMKTIRKHVRRRQRARALRLARKQSA